LLVLIFNLLSASQLDQPIPSAKIPANVFFAHAPATFLGVNPINPAPALTIFKDTLIHALTFARVS
jgi:hypothetical protein